MVSTNIKNILLLINNLKRFDVHIHGLNLCDIKNRNLHLIRLMNVLKNTECSLEIHPSNSSNSYQVILKKKNRMLCNRKYNNKYFI